LGQSDAKAFGLEKSDIVIEEFPMTISPYSKLDLQRIK
jgi:hypothetical protein